MCDIGLLAISELRSCTIKNEGCLLRTISKTLDNIANLDVNMSVKKSELSKPSVELFDFADKNALKILKY